MVTPQPKVTFLESWRKKVQPIQAMDAVDSEYPIAILEVNGSLSLLDSQGKSLFSVPTDGKARFLSLSQTCNSLLVLDDGSVALHGPRGESVWKKRGLNSAKGVASLSGNFFALITHDPTVILMDQSFRSKWTYRNLLKTKA
ncbi:hypothetical protein HYY75_09050 [bacterium]|nr:hypothetical protein [bacterium]